MLAGLALVWFGVTMYYFRIPFLDVYFVSDDWIPLVTVLWLLGMTQAINLIDGLDGLAAGIVAIGPGTFFLYAQRLADLDLLTQPNLGPMMAIIAVGLCIGFLPHNFNPARIFMGDSGALLLGLLMAVSTSVVGGRADPTSQAFIGQTFFFLAPLVIPLLILGAPARPAVRIVRRATPQGARRRGQGPPAPPPDEPRPRPPPQRADPVDVDGTAVGVRPLSVLVGGEPDVPAVRGRRSPSCCSRCSTRASSRRHRANTTDDHDRTSDVFTSGGIAPPEAGHVVPGAGRAQCRKPPYRLRERSSRPMKRIPEHRRATLQRPSPRADNADSPSRCHGLWDGFARPLAAARRRCYDRGARPCWRDRFCVRQDEVPLRRADGTSTRRERRELRPTTHRGTGIA